MMSDSYVRYSEKEKDTLKMKNFPVVFRAVCETRDYKYFAGVCRGF
jgi:hypothetical protein